ncbi:MAG: gamma-glutamylcyclotransferase [Pseudomonadota bacterium]
MTVPPDFWVFGYGSLMWRPGFEYKLAMRARLNGLHRSPCIYSWEHRGTRQRPGIVLGLDRGGSCVGTAFSVAGRNYETVMAYLRARELVTNVYFETRRNVQLADGRSVSAICYMVDRTHEQYAGRLSLDALVHQISGAKGKSGANEDYFFDTAKKLQSIGIKDPLMEDIATRLRETSNTKRSM